MRSIYIADVSNNLDDPEPSFNPMVVFEVSPGEWLTDAGNPVDIDRVEYRRAVEDSDWRAVIGRVAPEDSALVDQGVYRVRLRGGEEIVASYNPVGDVEEWFAIPEASWFASSGIDRVVAELRIY